MEAAHGSLMFLPFMFSRLKNAITSTVKQLVFHCYCAVLAFGRAAVLYNSTGISTMALLFRLSVSTGVMWRVLGRATGGAARSFCHVRAQDRSTLAKAESTSDNGSAFGTTRLKRGRSYCTEVISAREERSRNM